MAVLTARVVRPVPPLGAQKTTIRPLTPSTTLGSTVGCPLVGHHLMQRHHQFVGLERFGDEAACADEDSLAGVACVFLADEEEDDGVGYRGCEAADRRDGIRVAQVVVHDDDLGQQVLRTYEGQVRLCHPVQPIGPRHAGRKCLPDLFLDAVTCADKQNL